MRPQVVCPQLSYSQSHHPQDWRALQHHGNRFVRITSTSSLAVEQAVVGTRWIRRYVGPPWVRLPDPDSCVAVTERAKVWVGAVAEHSLPPRARSNDCATGRHRPPPEAAQASYRPDP